MGSGNKTPPKLSVCVKLAWSDMGRWTYTNTLSQTQLHTINLCDMKLKLSCSQRQPISVADKDKVTKHACSHICQNKWTVLLFVNPILCSHDVPDFLLTQTRLVSWKTLWTQHAKYVVESETFSIYKLSFSIVTLLPSFTSYLPVSLHFFPSPNPSLCKSVTPSLLQASVLQVYRRVYRSDRASQEWSGPWLQVP